MINSANNRTKPLSGWRPNALVSSRAFRSKEARRPVPQFSLSEQISVPDTTHSRKGNIYREASVGIVVAGAARYFGHRMSLMAIPGTVVCGNRGEEYGCVQEHASGNRRLVIDFTQSLIEDVAADLNLARAAFPAAMIAPSATTAIIFGLLRKMSATDVASEELAILVACHALARGTKAPDTWRLHVRDNLRVLDVVQFIGAHFEDPCTLSELAQRAGVSKFHFIRVFHAATGQSPAQYVINTRLRAAADRLTSTNAPVTQVALDVGFNDISHFNATFRSAFACSPRQWRTGRLG